MLVCQPMLDASLLRLRMKMLGQSKYFIFSVRRRDIFCDLLPFHSSRCCGVVSLKTEVRSHLGIANTEFQSKNQRCALQLARFPVIQVTAPVNKSTNYDFQYKSEGNIVRI